MNSGRFAFVVGLGVVLVVIGLAAFTVNERELAIKLQLGEVVRSDYEPGLHLKWPVIPGGDRGASGEAAGGIGR